MSKANNQCNNANKAQSLKVSDAPLKAFFDKSTDNGGNERPISGKPKEKDIIVGDRVS